MSRKISLYNGEMCKCNMGKEIMSISLLRLTFAWVVTRRITLPLNLFGIQCCSFLPSLNTLTTTRTTTRCARAPISHLRHGDELTRTTRASDSTTIASSRIAGRRPVLRNETAMLSASQGESCKSGGPKSCKKHKPSSQTFEAPISSQSITSAVDIAAGRLGVKCCYGDSNDHGYDEQRASFLLSLAWWLCQRLKRPQSPTEKLVMPP